MKGDERSPADRPAYVGLGPRFIALILDFFLLSLVFFPITRAVKGVWIMSSQDHLWEYGWFITDPLCLVFLVVIVLYFVVFEGTIGATIGKRLLGLRVVRVEGGPPGVGRALIRNVLRVVDALPAFCILGAALIATSPQRARFGDRIAGTRVIIRP